MVMSVTAQTTSWISAAGTQNMEVRQRNADRNGDEEAPEPEPLMTLKEQHLRRIAETLFCLDLKAVHTVTEDFTKKARLDNIRPHFKDLWVSPPVIETIEKYMESDELYHAQAAMDLPDFRQYVASLSYHQLAAAIQNNKATLYYVRLIKGRVWKLQEQKTMNSLAERDLPGSFEINLGLLIGEKAADQNDYLAKLIMKRFNAKARLSRVLHDALLLRDQVIKAIEQDALDKDLLPYLKRRLGALDEHFAEAWELLGEGQGEKLIDHAATDWLLRPDAKVAVTKTPPKPVPATLAFLAFFFSLVACYPAWRSFSGASSGPGQWSDPDFFDRLAAAILQLLSLCSQMIGPLVFPRIFFSRLEGEVKSLVWIVGMLTFICIIANVVVYGLVSVQLSGFIGFAGQAMMGLVQLMQIFGA